MFSGSMPQFSGLRLASFAPSVRSNLHCSQVSRPMFSHPYTYPTDFTPDLVEAAVSLLESLYRPGFHYQKCGVMFLDLSPATQVPADLFDPRDRAREARLVRALDLLNT